MKKFTFQFVTLIAIIFMGLLFYTGRIPNIPFISQLPQQKQVIINDIKIKIEIADTASKRSKGLGGRESLASDEGMLFIFEREDKYPFWMKGLKFPLDFIWIKGDKIVDILTNVSQPSVGQKDESLPIYQSKVPIVRVLEVNSGTVDRLHIKVDDTIKIE